MAKNSHFKDLQQLGPLEVLRADLDVEGSFDDAVAGCDYAFLVAAPVNIHAKNPEVRKHLQLHVLRFRVCLALADGIYLYCSFLAKIGLGDGRKS